ncbi:MAG: PLP-dependent aminotransferase family protein, partial [Candidatus Binataceae bacterium]
SVADWGRDLKVNKLTVHKVFQRLEKAGLVRSEVGRGTFVAKPDGVSNGAGPAAEPRADVQRSIRRLREGVLRGLRELVSVERRPGTINLAGGVPSASTVPDGLLDKLVAKALKRGSASILEYGGPAGLADLREILAAYLTRRGIGVTPDELIITNGSQQAITLAAAWTRDDGRTAICETPTYTGVPGAFMMFGHAVQSVAWENGAPNLDQLRAASTGRRTAFYLCADFHNPTGATAPLSFRRDLAAWARESDTVVIDDTIFRDLRFEGDEPAALYSLLPPGRRIAVGSISKVFMPGLRVGFLAADRALIGELLTYKRHMDMGGPPLTQAIAAGFLADGYAKHLERMRAYYRPRRDAAVAALKEFMPDGVTWTRPQGGFQLWVTLPRGISSIQLFLRGIEHGVAINPGPLHDIDGRYVNAFRLGYADATPDELRTGVRRLGEIIESLASRSPAHDSQSGLGILI